MLSERFQIELRELIDSGNPRRFSSINWQTYLGVVPEFLIELWKQVGTASWNDGSYQTINPELYKSAVEHALEGSPLENESVVPYMMYAFGRLTCWHTGLGLINIDPVEASITILADPDYKSPGLTSEIEILSAFIGMSGDDTNFGLYTASVNKYGELGENEIFSFVPAISLGGRMHVKAVQRQIADIQLDILCQSAKFNSFRVKGIFENATIVPFT